MDVRWLNYQTQEKKQSNSVKKILKQFLTEKAFKSFKNERFFQSFR